MRDGGDTGRSVQDEDACVTGVVRDRVLRTMMRAWRWCCGTECLERGCVRDGGGIGREC